jgi:hypothetical protein
MHNTQPSISYLEERALKNRGGRPAKSGVRAGSARRERLALLAPGLLLIIAQITKHARYKTPRSKIQDARCKMQDAIMTLYDI